MAWRQSTSSGGPYENSSGGRLPSPETFLNFSLPIATLNSSFVGLSALASARGLSALRVIVARCCGGRFKKRSKCLAHSSSLADVSRTISSRSFLMVSLVSCLVTVNFHIVEYTRGCSQFRQNV